MSSDLDLLGVNISNDEIRHRLTHEFKVDCGPVTASTRCVYLKKLINLEKEFNASTTELDDSYINNNDDVLTNSSIQQTNDRYVINGKHLENDESNSHPDFDDVPTFSVKKVSPRRYSPRRKTAEEIDAVKSFNEINKQLKKKQTISSDSSKKHKNPKNSIMKTVHLNSLSPKLNQPSESSESDEDDYLIENTPPSSLVYNSRIATPRIFNGDSTYKPSLSRAPIRKYTIENKSSLLNYSDSDTDVDELKNDKLCKMLLSHRPGPSGSRAVLNNNKSNSSYIRKISTFFSNLKNKFTRSPTDYSTSSSINFPTSSSNFISFALLVFVVVFFIVIFSVYFYAKFNFISKHTLDLNDFAFIEDKNKLIAPICKNNTFTPNECLQYESDRKSALNVVKEIKSYIDKSIYDQNCEITQTKPLLDITDFSFSVTEIHRELQSKASDLSSEEEERHESIKSLSANRLFERDFQNAIKLIKLNPSWNIKFDNDFSEILKLNANYAVHLPVKCSLLLFLRLNLWSIVSAVLALIIPTAVYFYFRMTKRAATEEKNLVYELIEKSMELLQSPDEPQSMPVLHIRDTLLSPTERKSPKYRKIWSKVVNHIENSESRVKVELKKIDGEDFKAWKWIATNSTSNYLLSETDLDGSLVPNSQTQKIGGVEWQGQAFGNVITGKNSATHSESNSQGEGLAAAPIAPEMYRNKNFQALTRFLKIRNIFEKEAQFFDSNWSKKIKNTIMEKTAKNSPTDTHDIVHIEIDDNTNEGLVYLKCASIAGATNAFHALHGWWCEKKLVSVKFLKEERYNMRFPQSKYANVPLKIEPIN